MLCTVEPSTIASLSVFCQDRRLASLQRGWHTPDPSPQRRWHTDASPQRRWKPDPRDEEELSNASTPRGNYDFPSTDHSNASTPRGNYMYPESTCGVTQEVHQSGLTNLQPPAKYVLSKFVPCGNYDFPSTDHSNASTPRGNYMSPESTCEVTQEANQNGSTNLQHPYLKGVLANAVGHAEAMHFLPSRDSSLSTPYGNYMLVGPTREHESNQKGLASLQNGWDTLGPSLPASRRHTTYGANDFVMRAVDREVASTMVAPTAKLNVSPPKRQFSEASCRLRTPSPVHCFVFRNQTVTKPPHRVDGHQKDMPKTQELVCRPHVQMLSTCPQGSHQPVHVGVNSGDKSLTDKDTSKDHEVSNQSRDCACPNKWPSRGSVGHPHQCADACKYFWKLRGCKDGTNCDHCHLCMWKPKAWAERGAPRRRPRP